MKRVAVFGGTAEGRALAGTLARRQAAVRAYVATGYGEELLQPGENLEVRAGRLDEDAMTTELCIWQPAAAVDATHPYAAAVSANIRSACERAGVPYLRFLRAPGPGDDVVEAADSSHAAELLSHMPGNVLLTVGSKELEAFTLVRDWRERLYARVLPSPEVVEKCAALGFRGRNLICMQGPFSHEMNVAMLHMLDIATVVTKDSGDVGGFGDKLSAAAACGARVIVVRRPVQETGYDWDTLMEELSHLLRLAPPPPVAKRRESVPRFPMFIPLDERPVLVVGGGTIAARRVATLLEFGAVVTVVSPALCPQLQELAPAVTWRRERYTGQVAGYVLVVAATDDREVNRRVGEDAKAARIPVSVADRREDSTFWFPAVVRQGNLVGGITSADGDHAAVKRTAGIIRAAMEETV